MWLSLRFTAHLPKLMILQQLVVKPNDEPGKVETEHAKGSQDYEGDEQNRLSINSETQELPTVSSSINPSDLYGILSVR